MKIAIAREQAAEEGRVAATPETVKKLTGLGATLAVEKGAGGGSRIPDGDYEAAGASVGTRASVLKDADVLLTVRRPVAKDLAALKKGALVIGMLDPYGHEDEVAALAKSGANLFTMEFMPRITRAQVMDVLSSQANLAGYQAVIEAATAFDRAMPMMMTAAGTVRPAKVFVMGAGVAGLQAIATAKRLGAVVSATDVRAAAGEQVESLGGKFIMTEALKDASGEGGYARELTKDEQAAQAELVAAHIAKQDMVITTALIPGRPAPKLVSKEMVASMAPGSVIVDLAVERGGNVEGAKPGETVMVGDVSIIGLNNMAGRIASTASQLYARNLSAFLETLIDKDDKVLKPDWEDELVKATLIARDGAIVHEGLLKAAGASTPAKKAPAKRAPAKKPAAKSTASKSTASTTTASKPAAKTATAKSTAAKSTAAKKPAAKKPAASKSAAGKSAAGKASTAKKAPASKSGENE
ncbi:Re/Si-specific NAD(P)(+) transhydrogenase subunit alpha [Cucumibacter marinus]|uniref:Re/Si-specific NAD(P)(+) transhydrogenase subunit alpha n=1 Tax=Cucumibacter marinus TaxID=1121252 RepID=UPI00042641F0|nr:Re/Si-specific NAD(P)(+) transhydrogenase subunit alpha [Cucumibacter marinus]